MKRTRSQKLVLPELVKSLCQNEVEQLTDAQLNYCKSDLKDVIRKNTLFAWLEKISENYEELGYSQTELARKCLAPRSSTNQWLNAKTTPENYFTLMLCSIDPTFYRYSYDDGVNGAAICAGVMWVKREFFNDAYKHTELLTRSSLAVLIADHWNLTYDLEAGKAWYKVDDAIGTAFLQQHMNDHPVNAFEKLRKNWNRPFRVTLATLENYGYEYRTSFR